MRVSSYRLSVGAVLAVLGGLPTVAAADDFDICKEQYGDVGIAACASAIASG